MSYYKEDIQNFKKEFASLRNATPEEKKEFDIRFKDFIASKSPEEKKELTAAFFASAKEEKERAIRLASYVDVRLKLEEVLDCVSMSYISKHYFQKSRSWFAQRLNNSVVNGIPASFNREELKILSLALDDIGSRMKDTARLIAD
jgi:hypothetical protein